MDLSLPIIFNGLTAQPITISPATPASGTTIIGVDFAQVPVDMSVEKNALSDGATLGDPFLSGRPILIRGEVWGTSKYDLWDKVGDWMSAFSPRSPSLEETAPLKFSRPTADISTWTASAIPLYWTCAPSREPWHGAVDRVDAAGGSHVMPVYAQLIAPDPYAYIDQNRVTQNLTTASATLSYRGEAPVASVDLWIRLSATGTGTVAVTMDNPYTTDIGYSAFTIDFSQLSANTTYVLSFSEGRVSLSGATVAGVIDPDSIFGTICPGTTASYTQSGTGTISFLQLHYPEAFF